jgi:multidrug efflux pump subunit AcrA (membrane-fusion protein)
MTDMPTAPAHAKPARRDGLIAAWLCLIIAGAATVTFNIVHAWRSGMASPLGFVEGVVPVALAMIVSHLVAISSAGRFLKGITFAVMIGALALSVRATGTVVAPAAGPLWWLYGAVVDTAALVSLQVLLALKARAAREARERAEAEAAAADERAALRAALETARAGLDEAHAALATARTELARTTAKAEAAERKLAAQKPKRTRTQTAPARRTKAPAAEPHAVPHAAPGSADRTMLPDDFDARGHALELWLANPDISGKDLAEACGMKERWGQLRKNEFATAAPADPQARSES